MCANVQIIAEPSIVLYSITPLGITSYSQGATFPFSPCGHAFMPAPDMAGGGGESLTTEVTMNIDQLMENVTKV